MSITTEKQSREHLFGIRKFIRHAPIITFLLSLILVATGILRFGRPLEFVFGFRKSSFSAEILIHERKWKGMPPRWCAELLRQPRERPRRGFSDRCKRDRFGALCQDGTPRFFSQYNQDIWLWKNHWRHLRRRGVYLDIAANEPVWISNTYFYDKCLQWRGICAEANEQYRDLLVRMRSCAIMPTCVSNRTENVTFVMDAGSGGVVSTNKNNIKENRPRVRLTCVPTSEAIEASGFSRIDMLSLDVEGHELKVLQGINWEKTRINVIVIESVRTETLTLLKGLGYRLADMPSSVKEKAKDGSLLSDFVFLHRDVVWGSPV